MIKLPLETLPVDFLTLFMALFRNQAENQTGDREIKVSSDNYEVFRGRSKGKRDCISTRKF